MSRTTALAQSELELVHEFTGARGLEVWFHDSWDWYAPRPSLASEEEHQAVRVAPRSGLPRGPVSKAHIVLAQSVATTARASEYANELRQSGLQAWSSKPQFVEVVSGKTSSHKGADLVAARLGLEPSQLIAVGDSMNDVGMFDFAGKAFTFSDAPGALRSTGATLLPSPSGGGLVNLASELARLLNPPESRTP